MHLPQWAPQSAHKFPGEYSEDRLRSDRRRLLWFRKNTLLGLVGASDSLFATLVVASMAFVLLFMYAVAADPVYRWSSDIALAVSQFLGGESTGILSQLGMQFMPVSRRPTCGSPPSE